MTQRLESFLSGAWCDGQGPHAALKNPATGETVAETSTKGLDLGAALDFARETGGAALAALSFAERGALLAAMSKAIHAERETLIDLGRINSGNTRGDAKFDIDGATGTLMYYAKLGESLGDRKVLLDGDAIQLGRDPRLKGQHVLVPRPGVAIHINAFNFPAWGLAEKAACAILAGMPVLSKPGTATAMLTWRLVKAVVDADVLPAGVLSLLCGSAGDLLDHVQWCDVIAFTGSAETGRRITSHPAVIAAGVPVNVEADSLNATVLAPDVDEATYDAFIRDVHREVTQKSGQKCTATRRIFVPADDLDTVVEDLSERFARAITGDPERGEVNMGPLSSAAQLASARQGIAALLEETEVVFGDPTGGVIQGDAAGCYVTPLLLKAKDPSTAQAIHNLEVFGPVATLIGYDGEAASAVAGVRKGEGSLVCSIYSDDKGFSREALLGLAGWHGRIVLYDAKVANKSISPGTVMPHLMHGGPGRAGGGVELGGTRGMGLYQQRCAIQGNAPLIARLLEG